MRHLSEKNTLLFPFPPPPAPFFIELTEEGTPSGNLLGLMLQLSRHISNQKLLNAQPGISFLRTHSCLLSSSAFSHLTSRKQMENSFSLQRSSLAKPQERFSSQSMAHS
ncbi:uncharacterized [Tachysurus ichikawai]